MAKKNKGGAATALKAVPAPEPEQEQQQTAESTSKRGARAKNPPVPIRGTIFNGETRIKDFDAEITARDFKQARGYLNWAFNHVGLKATYIDPTQPPTE